jgi:hypothetical protein
MVQIIEVCPKCSAVIDITPKPGIICFAHVCQSALREIVDADRYTPLAISTKVAYTQPAFTREHEIALDNDPDACYCWGLDNPYYNPCGNCGYGCP